MESTMSDNTRTTRCGNYFVTNSAVARLEKDLKKLKNDYDCLKIKQIFMKGMETDPAKLKADDNKLEGLKKQIKKNEEIIMEIKLDLK